MFCVSDNEEKLNPWVLGKSAKPRALRGIQSHELNVIYKSNQKVWMIGKQFRECVNAVNKKMGVQNRNILLIVNNAPGHPKIEASNVKLHFLPPNSTSKLQTLVRGIIAVYIDSYVITLGLWAKYDIDGHYSRFAA